MTKKEAKAIAETIPYCGGTTLRIHDDERWESPIVSLKDGYEAILVLKSKRRIT